jgi:hypothetical protein
MHPVLLLPRDLPERGDIRSNAVHGNRDAVSVVFFARVCKHDCKIEGASGEKKRRINSPPVTRMRTLFLFGFDPGFILATSLCNTAKSPDRISMLFESKRECIPRSLLRG